MFKQRLTRDELGMAIRKISGSGKAQLRYVTLVSTLTLTLTLTLQRVCRERHSSQSVRQEPRLRRAPPLRTLL